MMMNDLHPHRDRGLDKDVAENVNSAHLLLWAKLAKLIPVDYFQAREPAFRMYLRISFMMLSMVRQVRRYGPP